MAIQVWAELGAVLLTCKQLQGIAPKDVQCPTSHTSSSDKPCLNTLIVLFISTKGKDRPITTPTLATVSLWVNCFSFCVHQSTIRGQLSPMKCSYDYLPDTKEVNGYRATEHLLEPLDEAHFAWMSGPVVSVCKRNLLHVVF